MGLQYITVPENNFSGGIDARSSENQIDPGFVQDLLNADIVEKRARKRPGYQGYAGNLPVRASQMEYLDASNEVRFTLDSAISLDSQVSLENVRSSPLVIYGRSSVFTTGQGPFTDTDSVHYYSAFSVPLRKVFLAPSGTLEIPAEEHGLGTTNMFVGVVESLNPSTRDFQTIDVDAIEIDESSYDIDIDYTVAQDTDVFVYYSDKDSLVGSSYVATLNHDGTPTSQTFSIPSGTHGLANFNIVPQLQQDLGTSRVTVRPDSLTVAANGDVSVEITNGTGSAQDYIIILSAAPIPNIVTGNIGAESTGIVTIPTPEKPWVFPAVYLEQTPGGTKELVQPDYIEYSETDNEFTVNFTNQAAVARNFIVFYEYGALRTNQLTVTDLNVTVTGEDLVPQITIWGLSHEEIYGQNKQYREGWVNHIDSYRRSGEQRVITGLGGNLFAAKTYAEASTQYSLPQLYPNNNTRTATDVRLGRRFWDSGETPGLTRGYITSDNSGTGWATVTSVEYDTGSGLTCYTLSLPNKQVLNSSGTPTSLTSVISTTTGLWDYLTVQGMSYARHAGTFRIRQIQDGTNEILIWVENDQNTEDYDDSNLAGEAGIFTDQVTWSSASPYIPEDLLLSDALTDDNTYTTMSSLGSVTVIAGVIDMLDIAAGVIFTGARTSNCIPMRTGYPSPTASTTNLVRGDILSYTGISRLVRVLYINPDQNRTINISGDGETATAVMTSGDTSYLTVGSSAILTQAGVYTGTVVITNIIDIASFQFVSEETDAVTGAILVGETATIDEDLSWSDTQSDSSYFRIESRWIPLEAPDDSFNLTPSTHTRYLDSNTYSLQPFLRSTMVVDNMYFTNNDDEVYKFDGANIYRSGIIPWQPGAFLTQDTDDSNIVTNLRTVAYSAIAAGEGKITVSPGSQGSIPVGASVRLSGSTQTYFVSALDDDGTDFFVLLDRALDASVTATGDMSEIGVFRYYYRLNAVDINDNIIASAVTGFQDHVVELTEDAAIQHKLVGLPAWDVYDYDRLEVQIYRTKMNSQAPFYKITTLPMDFNNSTGYIQFRDSFADSDLIELDEVNTALKGVELGTAWVDAPRAKYMSSINNRLVLANIRDYPQLDIQIVADAATTNAIYAGDNLLFRRNNSDALTTTNNIDRIRYEWISGVTGNMSGISYATNTFTVEGIAEAVTAGSWIYLTYETVDTAGRDLTLSGWWQIASVSGAGPYDATIRYTGITAPADEPDAYVLATNPLDVPVLLGVDGNLGMVNGDSFDTFDAMRRMGMAINASQRQVDILISGMESYTPWLVARSGNDTPPAGRLIVRQPRSDATTLEVVPTFSGYNLFINSVRKLTGSQTSASTRIFGSRIVVSYENYPEIFDNPSTILDKDSDSAIDVNSADGQDITGVIPFFGEAAFGAAQQSAVLVVFKTNSIYLVDINQKVLGQNPVQRIETEGLGCTAPYSIAVTKNGIMFANESGMYCLRRTQAIEYIGRFMERNWVERVSLDSLGLAQGHHYGVGRVYKLSVPIQDTEASNGYLANSEAYVYNHTQEAEQGRGAWSRYDNHPVTGWANLANDAYFGATSGRVFSIRRTGSNTDFRDDNQGINLRLDTRANDFGNAGIRKVTDNVVIHYRNTPINTGTEVSYALDLEEEYSDTTAVNLTKPVSTTNLSDIVAKSILSIRHNLERRRSVYTQIRIENSNLDESVEIAGIDYRIGGLSVKGITQAAETDD